MGRGEEGGGRAFEGSEQNIHNASIIKSTYRDPTIDSPFTPSSSSSSPPSRRHRPNTMRTSVSVAHRSHIGRRRARTRGRTAPSTGRQMETRGEGDAEGRPRRRRQEGRLSGLSDRQAPASPAGLSSSSLAKMRRACRRSAGTAMVLIVGDGRRRVFDTQKK